MPASLRKARGAKLQQYGITIAITSSDILINNSVDVLIHIGNHNSVVALMLPREDLKRPLQQYCPRNHRRNRPWAGVVEAE